MPSPLQLDRYDVIICGGGTAGCVLAARLSEEPSLSVLLLEAGENENENPTISTPGLFAANLNNPKVDWQYVVEPSPGLNGRGMIAPRGKCLGGSSAINLMALIYPSKACLDAWAEFGNPGWDWESMAPYYRKFHTQHLPSSETKEALSIDYIDPKLHGTDGPISSSYPAVTTPLQKAWVETWKGMQQAITGDPLAGTYAGGYTSTTTINPRTGQRSHAGIEYYAPAAGRANLHLVTGALIEKIEVDASDAASIKATGVTFTHVHSNTRHTAHAAREVILSGGVYGSPAILERSGIGAASLLSSLGITSVLDNPNVGENLRDHLMVGRSYEVRDGISTIDMVRDPAVTQAAMEQYHRDRTGMLAGGASYSFASTPVIDFAMDEAREELKKLFDAHLPSSSDRTFAAEQRYYDLNRRIIESPTDAPSSVCFVAIQTDCTKEAVSEMFAPSRPENYVTLFPALAHPFGRGSSHVRGADADVPPVVDHRYLSHELDVEILARQAMQMEKLAESEPLASFLKPGGCRIPDGDYDARTLERAREFVRHSSTSNYHPSGTLAMLPRELGGVVDARLLVHGTKNLRVCDASIFPFQPRGNIQSTVYAVAEKGADMFKEDLGLGKE